MTSDGGDPVPLTYGDFDATAPRWSHDGGRIAYVSNEGGNTSLWVIELPGGRLAPFLVHLTPVLRVGITAPLELRVRRA